jgi:HlyD family secretion protein
MTRMLPMNLPLPTLPAGRKFLLVTALIGSAACRDQAPTDRVRVSGQVEATDVQVAAVTGGRLLELKVAEGQRVEQGALVARLDAADAELTLVRARAERDQADAQWRLLRAGARPEELRQAEAQVAAARSEAGAAEAELGAAEKEVARFEALVASNSGSRKQLDDAIARRDVARERARSAHDRVRAAEESLVRLRAGARREELDAAAARVAAAEAQIAIWQKAIADAIVTAPIAGIVTEKIADAGELLQPRGPIVVITDLDHAWANVYVDEPIVPRLRIGQPATIFTDAGGSGIRGEISAIASRAEFTPRNVQTAEDRSKLVYRIKVSVDNTSGVLKAGMPVEAEIPLQP